MKNLTFVLLLLLSLSSSAADKGAAQIARFSPWMETLRESLESSSNIDEVVTDLLNGEARIASFNLQALGRLYSSENKFFKELRSTFKKMEDSIGEYDKWNKVLAEAKTKGKSAEVIAKLQAKAENAKKIFKAYLKSEKWVLTAGESQLDLIQKKLESYKWESYKDDKAQVLSVLKDQLEDVDDTTYDMTILEEGDGLHELRRELRWFLIEARVLNGLVTFDKSADQVQSCPIADYEDLVKNKVLAQGKYSKLPQSITETEPCFISQCLFLGLVDAVDKLGSIKDQAERTNNISGDTESDQVPAELVEEAKAVYSGLQETNLLSTLASEIKSCK